MLGGSPDSGSWTTVGIKKTPTSASQVTSPAPVLAEVPKPPASSPQAPRAGGALPGAPAAGQPRASLQALAAARSHTASMLKAQVSNLPQILHSNLWSWYASEFSCGMSVCIRHAMSKELTAGDMSWLGEAMRSRAEC